MDYKIIATTGYKQSGKDFVCNQIEKYLNEKFDGLNVIRVSFADEMKSLVHHLFGWSESYISNPPKGWKETVIPELGFSPRQAYEKFGTDFIRSLVADFWISRVKETIESKLSMFDENIVVIPDVRFPNEYEWIKSHQSIVTKVHRFDVSPDVIRDDNGSFKVINQMGELVPEPESYIHTFIHDVIVYNDQASQNVPPDLSCVYRKIDLLMGSTT